MLTSCEWTAFNYYRVEKWISETCFLTSSSWSLSVICKILKSICGIGRIFGDHSSSRPPIHHGFLVSAAEWQWIWAATTSSPEVPERFQPCPEWQWGWRWKIPSVDCSTLFLGHHEWCFGQERSTSFCWSVFGGRCFEHWVPKEGIP